MGATICRSLKVRIVVFTRWVSMDDDVSASLEDGFFCSLRISDPNNDYDESFKFSIPRAFHSLNFVNNHLAMFGGGCQGGFHIDDTWTAYTDKSNQNILKWKKVESETPSGRFRRTCIIICEHLLLFGGINNHG